MQTFGLKLDRICVDEMGPKGVALMMMRRRSVWLGR